MKETHFSLCHTSVMQLAEGCDDLQGFVASLPARFEQSEGKLIHDGRNKLREISYKANDYVVKSYKKPNPVNRLVYGLLRPSKAKRSFCNALLLKQISVGTPDPVGYLNVRNGLLFTQSFLITRKSVCRYRYDQLFDTHTEMQEAVAREVGRITAVLHENNLSHLDYGRGNILFDFDKQGNVFLELVDLNRMRHGTVDIKAGCKNLERLPATAQMHRWLAQEYALARDFDEEECYRLMRAYRSVQPGLIEGEF